MRTIWELIWDRCYFQLRSHMRSHNIFTWEALLCLLPHPQLTPGQRRSWADSWRVQFLVPRSCSWVIETDAAGNRFLRIVEIAPAPLDGCCIRPRSQRICSSNFPDGKNLCAKMCITMRKCAEVCQTVPICANLCQAVPNRAKVGIIRTFYAVWHSLAQFDTFRHSYAQIIYNCQVWLDFSG